MGSSSSAASPESTTDCPICIGPLKDPYSLSLCKHEFCRSCLHQALIVNRHCPKCRGTVETHDIANIDVDGASSNAPIGRPQIFDRSNQTPGSISVANSSTPAPTPFPRSAATLRPIVTPPPHPREAVPSFSSLSSDDDSDSLSDLDDIVEKLQFNQSIRLSQTLSPAESLFSCPYCQEEGLDQLGLLDHCNQNHQRDTTSVVCPVCVSLPHGNPTQVSRNFIGHLNLRHCYYTNDYMNASQSDSMNEQDAIFESYRVSKQNAG